MATRMKLTDLDVEVLRAAARDDGSVWRSESGYPMHSYLGRKNVNRQVEKLCSVLYLIKPADQRDRFIRPWVITDAGRAVLAEHREKTR